MKNIKKLGYSFLLALFMFLLEIVFANSLMFFDIPKIVRQSFSNLNIGAKVSYIVLVYAPVLLTFFCVGLVIYYYWNVRFNKWLIFTVVFLFAFYLVSNIFENICSFQSGIIDHGTMIWNIFLLGVHQIIAISLGTLVWFVFLHKKRSCSACR
jgi:small-conductance mechanosensitive channel